MKYIKIYYAWLKFEKDNNKTNQKFVQRTQKKGISPYNSKISYEQFWSKNEPQEMQLKNYFSKFDLGY